MNVHMLYTAWLVFHYLKLSDLLSQCCCGRTNTHLLFVDSTSRHSCLPHSALSYLHSLHPPCLLELLFHLQSPQPNAQPGWSALDGTVYNSSG